MKSWLFSFVLAFSVAANARVEVLFHPHDPTLEKIAQWISEAQSTVDIAMYNMETNASSPVIQMLQSPEIQSRIQLGQLQVRLTLELYGTPEENQKKRQQMEDLGIDVRYLGQSIKVHHKFAVIDANGPVSRVVTGSANWSLSSYRSYNENILFFTNESEATARYALEFDRLWKASKEFGFQTEFHVGIPQMVAQDDLQIFFNSPRTISPESGEPSNLTAQVVQLINSAQTELQIATTRIRLVPILEALQAAAARGVKISAVISQDDLRDLGRRAKYLDPRMELRIKFYNLKIAQYMTYQMHNKFMIVDQNTIVSGSFNWSESSEKNHIENLIVLSGAKAKEVLPDYLTEFDFIWNMGRDQFAPTLQALQSQQHSGCAIPQMVLSQKEIRELLKFSKTCSVN